MPLLRSDRTHPCGPIAMIRKTLICIVGVLAGASTGAYVDGFFEQENLVTNAYHQIASQINPSVDSGDLDDANSAEPTYLDSDTDTNVATTSMAAANSAVSETAGPSPDKAKTSSDASIESDVDEGKTAKTANSDKLPSKNAEQSQVSSKKITSDADKLTEEMSSVIEKESSSEVTENELADKGDVADVDDTAEAADDEKVKEEQLQLEKAKSLALMDVRFANETFKSTSGGELKYRKLSPRTAGSGEPLPLVVFLHGLGECGDDNLSQLKHGLTYLASREGMQEYPATIIAPQCPEGQRWTTTLAERPGPGKLELNPSEVMRLTMELIDTIQLTDNIDPNRVYITGLSMGGFGTFDLIARRPNLFAAAVPMCGGGDISSEVVNRIKDVPLWIIHGDQDPVVDVKYSREMVEALKEAGGSPRYSELAGFKHNIWDAAYADTELYKWMFNQSKAGPLNKAEDASQMMASRDDAKTNGSQKRSPQAPQKNSGQSSVRNNNGAASLKASLQGEWKVLAATQRGRRADAATLAKMRVAFNDDALIIRIGDRNEIAKFRLLPNRSTPYPWIDIISQRQGVKDSPGILAKQGDKLVLCWAVPGAPRPTTFDSKEGIKTLVLEAK